MDVWVGEAFRPLEAGKGRLVYEGRDANPALSRQISAYDRTQS